MQQHKQQKTKENKSISPDRLSPSATEKNQDIQLNSPSPSPSPTESRKKKIDMEDYSYWYYEAKNQLKKGYYVKSYTFLNKNFEKRQIKLSKLQKLKTIRLFLSTILNLLLKKYLLRDDTNRIELIQSLMKKASFLLNSYYKQMLNLILSDEKNKTLMGKIKLIDRKIKFFNSVKSIFLQRNYEKINEEDSEDEDFLIKQMKRDSSNLFNEEMNELISPKVPEIEIKKKTLLFLLDELLIDWLKLVLCLAIIFKKQKETQLHLKVLLFSNEIINELENSKNADILSNCIKLKIILANFYAEINDLDKALEFYDQCLSLASKSMVIQFNKTKSKMFSDFSYHHKFEECTSQLILILNFMSIVYEIQGNVPKCFESSKLAYWMVNGFFDEQDELFKYTFESLAILYDKYHSYLNEIGEINKIFSSILNLNKNSSNKTNTTIEKTYEETFLESHNSKMYYKYNYDKLNETLFIPVNTNNTNTFMNTSQMQSSIIKSCVLPSRIQSAKTNTNSRFLDVEGSTMLHHKISDDFNTKKVVSYENLTLNISPTNQFNILQGPKGITYNSVTSQNAIEIQTAADANLISPNSTYNRNARRVYSAKIERGEDNKFNFRPRSNYKSKTNIKIIDTISENNNSISALLNLTYHPKQLTTDKYFKDPVFRVKNLQEIIERINAKNSKTEEGQVPEKKEKFKLAEIMEMIRESFQKKRRFKSNIISKEDMDLNLDIYFEKYIHKQLNSKTVTKPIKLIMDEFFEIMRDEDFDKKEFDFSTKMLKMKKKFKLPNSNSENMKEASGLNRINEHKKITDQIQDISCKASIISIINKRKEVQNELENEMLTRKIRNTIIDQQNNENNDIKPIKEEKKSKLQSVLFKQRNKIGIKKVYQNYKKEKKYINSLVKTQPSPRRSLAKKEIMTEKQIEELNKKTFLLMIDSVEKEIENIDDEFNEKKQCKNNLKSTKTFRNPQKFPKPKIDRLKFVNNFNDLAISTKLLSVKSNASKNKLLNMADLAIYKSQLNKLKEIKINSNDECKSPLNRSKSRYKINFEYANKVESSLNV